MSAMTPALKVQLSFVRTPRDINMQFLNHGRHKSLANSFAWQVTSGLRVYEQDDREMADTGIP